MYIADDTPASNSLNVLPDGIIEIKETGHQTRASVQQYQDQVDQMVSQLRQSQKKALILVDLGGVTGHDSDVRDVGREMLKSDFDALALFGENTTVRMIANWLIKTAGQDQRVRFFDSRKDALDWLHQH